LPATIGGGSRPASSPAPADDLDGLWLFDGVCTFCSGSVQTALRLDRKGVLRFTPLQSPFGRAIAGRYGLDLENPDSFLFFDRWRDAAYLLLARNRYRLLGKKDACMVPTPQQRARFILEPPPGWS
jgi:predicted DCC family thiol-disulfide oxidoreductase YuxK